MKFLIDMGLAWSAAAFLRDRGHDAIHLRDEGLQRLHDSEIGSWELVNWELGVRLA